jgi:hypothetical protein
MLAGCLPFGAAQVAAIGRDDEEEPPPLAQFRGDVPEPLSRLLTEQLRSRPSARPHSATEVAQRLRAIENILATGYTLVSGEEEQAPPAGEPSPPIIASPATERPTATNGGTQPSVPQAAGSNARVHEADGAHVSVYEDLDALQEELGGSLDEIIVTVSAPAKIRGRAKWPLQTTPATLYATLAALILGIACGLWVINRRAFVSSTTLPQAASAAEVAEQREPAAFAETPSNVGAVEPSADDKSLSPAGAEEQSPGEVVESAPASHEAPGPKVLEAKPSAAAELRREAGADAPAVSDGREAERRQGVGRCVLSVSESSLSIPAGGRSDTITVNVTSPAHVTATTNNWPDIAVFKESRGDESGTVRYSVMSVSKRAGTFSVNFKSPCGMKTIPITVKQH